ncbi:MAG: hypothetical protein ABIL76_03050 [candidate division WOR-3 bacterium]
MKNFFILLFLSIVLYLFSAISKIYYETKNYKKTFISDLSSLNNVLNKNYVGTIADSYHYIKNAYSVYKNLKPIDCFRPQAGYLFAPFMFIFKNYFPISVIIFNSVVFGILLAILFYVINPKHLFFNIILLILTFSFTFYYIPRIMLEPINAIFILISLLFFHFKKYNFSLIFLFLSSLIRPEFLIILIIFLIALRKWTLGSILSITSLTLIINLSRCEEQSNFFFWSIKGYYENIRNLDWQSAKIELSKRCQIVNNNCYKEVLIEEFKNNSGVIVLYAVKNFITNPIKLLFFPIDKYKKFLLIIYIFLSLVYSSILIYSFFKTKEKLIFISIVILLIVYDFCFILNPVDSSRFKLFVLPFEIYIILKTLSDNQFQLYNYFPFSRQK